MTEQSGDTNPHKDRRRWWIALLMLFPTGIGYIYVGRPMRFVAYMAFGFIWTAVLLHGAWGWLSDPVVFLAFIASIIVAIFGFSIDIVIISLKQNSHDLRWLHRRKWYVFSVALWIALVLLTDGTDTGPNLAVRQFFIPSGSNTPTIKVGDNVITDTRIYNSSDPRRGDLVVFISPKDNTTNFVKRIVGLPGDSVQMIKGALYLNGAAVLRKALNDYEDERGRKIKQFSETLPGGRTYATLDVAPDMKFDNTQVYQVPSNHYFVLGDNRDNSLDSRVMDEIGFVPGNRVYAKVTGITYAYEWRRIGLKLD